MKGPKIDEMSDDEENHELERVHNNPLAAEDLDNAISIGHVVVERGSEPQDENVDALVNLFQSINVPLTQMNDSDFLKCFSVAATYDCPDTYEEAVKSVDRDKWLAAMNNEMHSINEAETWELEEMKNLPQKPVKCRWIFTKKFDKFGNVRKYKARLVAKGYSQKYGIDYQETFAPVIKFKSVRTLIALAAGLKLDGFQDDVPSAFLKGVLKEKVIMTQPEGFHTGGEHTYCNMKKTLYGLKQSPREWNEVLDTFMKSEGFEQSRADTCIYSKKGKHHMLVGIYVDDIVSVGKGENSSRKVWN